MQKMNFDDNAMKKTRNFKIKRPKWGRTSWNRGKQIRSSFIKLDGSIAKVNGAGLAMATMDIIKLYGQEPTNF